MIDHISLAVRDLASSAAFYEAVLAPLGYRKLVERPASIGFGKKYPEIWLNARPDMARYRRIPAPMSRCGPATLPRWKPSIPPPSGSAAAMTVPRGRARRP